MHRSVLAALMLLAVPISGCLGGDDGPDPSALTITWNTTPADVAPSSTFTVGYRIDGPEGDVDATGVRAGPQSVQAPNAAADYPDGGTAASTTVPGEFTVELAAPASGTLHVRAYATIGSETVWGPERAIPVEADGGDGTSGIDDATIEARADDEGSGRVTVTWTLAGPAAGNATELEVFAVEGAGASISASSTPVATVNSPGASGSTGFNLQPGTWTVQARAHDGAGGTTWSNTVSVTVAAPPAPQLAADAGDDQTVADVDGDGEENVTLDGSGSSDPDHNITSYEWTLDGSELGVGETLDVDLDVGEHTIRLTVTNEAGDEATDTVTITVLANQAPIANAGAARTVGDADGDGKATVTLDGSGSSDPDGEVVSYRWTEDGTELSTAESFEVDLGTGTHTITLTVTDDGGATDSDTVNITVAANQAPDAAFQHVCSGISCVFDASGSTDPEGGELTYAWDFGDGDTLSDGDEVVDHTFPEADTYTVRLTVTDEGGETDSVTASIEIGAIEISSTAFQDSGTIPEKYTCDGAGDGVSPPLTIRNVTGSAKDLVLYVVDVDAQNQAGDNFVHWIMWNLTADASGTLAIPENGVPPNAVQGDNDFDGDTREYGPPCPDITDEDHTYRFIIVAVNVELDHQDTRADVEAVIGDDAKVLDKHSIEAEFGRGIL